MTIFSAIPIFLAFLVNAYAIFILYVKHMIFYNDYENTNYYLHKKTKESPGIDMQGVSVSKTVKNCFVLQTGYYSNFDSWNIVWGERD